MRYKVETMRNQGSVDRSDLSIVDLRESQGRPPLIRFPNVSDVALADEVCEFLNDKEVKKVA